MSGFRLSRGWVFSAVGCGLLLSAVIWEPPFQRELIVFGVVALMLALTGLLRRSV
jgi:hypothetical protein